MIYRHLTDWTVTGFHPYTAIQGKSMELGQNLMGCTKTVPAKVPGSVYMDLWSAGIIENPYYEMNSLKCEWVANRWWTYVTEFEIPESMKGKKIRIVFKGIDYKAHIYFNKMTPVIHNGMYTKCIIDVTDHVKFDEMNALHVVIEHAPDEMGQIGHTSMTHTQKSRFNYKWDFGTRLVNLGLYDDVTVEVNGSSVIENQHVRYDDKIVSYSAEISGISKGVKLSAELSYNGEIISTAEAEVTDKIANVSLPVDNPKLWYPNGYGDQPSVEHPLYDLKLTLIENDCNNDCVSDEKQIKIGLRTLSYERCDHASADSLPYLVSVNEKRIYIKGVNITPLDHMYGCVDRERYEKFIKLAAEANVNLIRVWGGGLIEKEDFYDMCDRYGIMVWQEFIQSSSGIDNIPSKKPEFLELCAKTAVSAVKEKRNHVSLTFWSGGNELMDEHGIPSTYEDENIAMLKKITDALDPDRLMLPTSASGPSEFLDIANPEKNHDVHGPWKYGGAEDHYRTFNASASQLHSEFGCDGMSNLSSIKTILAPENQIVTTVAENLTWRFHGEWWDTYGYRDFPVFREIRDLETFVKLSQYMQAESIRYSVEANRRRAWQNCGSIVWQFNEPWPNVSCTSLIDYYMNPKFAYYFYRDAMKPLHISLRYEKLIYKPGDIFKAAPFIHDDLEEGAEFTVRILNDKKQPLADFSDSLDSFEWTVGAAGRVFYAECTCTSSVSGQSDVNLYMFFVTDETNISADQSAVIDYIDQYFT